MHLVPLLNFLDLILYNSYMRCNPLGTWGEGLRGPLCTIFATCHKSIINVKAKKLFLKNCILVFKKEVIDRQLSLLGQHNRTSQTQRWKGLFNHSLPVRVTLISKKLTSWDPAGPSNPCNDYCKLLAVKERRINMLSCWHWGLGNGFLLRRVPNNNSACRMPHLPNSKPQAIAQILFMYITQYHTVRAQRAVWLQAKAKMQW